MDNWIVENLGWTLLHSLWQIGFVALILFVVLQILRDFSAHLRYALSILALSLSFILPVLTFVYFSSEMKQTQTIIQNVSPLSKQTQIQETKGQIISETVDVPPAVSVEKSVSSPSSNIPLMPIVVGLWLIGIVFFSVRLLGGIWTIHLYKTRKISIAEAHWQTKFDELCKHLKIRQKVRFLQSKKVEMPMVIGWLKPVVLVPASAFLQISPKELETILIHELIHIKRRDYLVNFLQSLVEILFFYHPFVWWISAKIRAEREFAVDEFLSQIFETERIIYAKALASLEENRLIPTTNLVMAANGGNLMKRIENILNGNRKINSRNVSIWSAVFAVTFVLGVTAGFYWLKTSDFRKSKSGRKIAVQINSYGYKNNQVEYKNILRLQKQYDIPATWIIDSNLIDTLKQNDSAREFFRRAKETNSDFILNIPNIDPTIYIDGLESYTIVWKERIQFVNSNLAEYGDKLNFYTTYSSQIPQPIEDYLKESQISFMPPLRGINDGYRFDYFYEKRCIRIENVIEKKLACRDTEESEKREVREKYLQFNRDFFEFRSNYSREKFGVETSQFLSLTTNSLLNVAADELIRMLDDNGYEFVPLDETVRKETKKLQESLWKDPESNAQEHRISQKYEDGFYPFNQLPKLPDEKKTKFNIEVNIQKLKTIEK